MAGAQIGPVNAKVVASATGMDAGLRDAEGKLKGSLGRMVGQAQKAGGAIRGTFKEAFVEGLGLSVGMKAFDAAKGAFDKVFGLYAEGSQRILDIGKAAEGVGADLFGFQAIVQSVGDLELAKKAVDKFTDALANAATAPAGKANAFTELGLDPHSLAEMSKSDAWRTFAESIKGVNNELVKSMHVGEVFGNKMADDIIPELNKGAAGVDRWLQSLRRSGSLFGTDDLANVRKVKNARKEIDLIFTGLTNQLTIGLSPVLGVVADQIGDLLPSAENLARTLLELFEKAGMAVSRFADMISEEGLWGAAQRGAKQLMDILVGGWKLAKQGAEELWGVAKEGMDHLMGLAKEWGPKIGEELGQAIGQGVQKHLREAFKLDKLPAGPMDLVSPSKLMDVFSLVKDNLDWKTPGMFGIGPGALLSPPPWFKGLFGGGDGETVQAAGPSDAEVAARAKTLADKARDALARLTGGGQSLLDRILFGTGQSGQNQVAGQFNTFMTQVMAKFGAMTDAAKANDPFVIWRKNFQTLVDEIDQADPVKKFKDAGDNMVQVGQRLSRAFEQTANPFDVRGMMAQQAQLDQFNKVASLKMAREFKAFKAAFAGVTGYQPTPALIEGTREAYSAITARQFGTQGSVEEQMRAILEAANRMQAEELRVGQEVRDALLRMEQDQAVVFGM